MERNSSLKCGLLIVTFFKEYILERGAGVGKSKFPVEKLEKHYLKQIINLNINSDKLC